MLLLLYILPDRLFLHFEQIDAHIQSIWWQEPFLEDIFLSLPGECVSHQLLHSFQLFCFFNASDGLLLSLSRLALDLWTPTCDRTALDWGAIATFLICVVGRKVVVFAVIVNDRRAGISVTLSPLIGILLHFGESAMTVLVNIEAGLTVTGEFFAGAGALGVEVSRTVTINAEVYFSHGRWFQPLWHFIRIDLIAVEYLQRALFRILAQTDHTTSQLVIKLST